MFVMDDFFKMTTMLKYFLQKLSTAIMLHVLTPKSFME